jgi:hypothetical protein
MASQQPPIGADATPEQHIAHDSETNDSMINEKTAFEDVKDSASDPEPNSKTDSDFVPHYGGEDADAVTLGEITATEDIVAKVIDLTDDPSQDPWTFRTFFIGM